MLNEYADRIVVALLEHVFCRILFHASYGCVSVRLDRL